MNKQNLVSGTINIKIQHNIIFLLKLSTPQNTARMFHKANKILIHIRPFYIFFNSRNLRIMLACANKTGEVQGFTGTA